MRKLNQRELQERLEIWKQKVQKNVKFIWWPKDEQAYKQITKKIQKKEDQCGNCDFFSQKIFGADNSGKCFRFYKDLKTILWVQYNYWCECHVA